MYECLSFCFSFRRKPYSVSLLPLRVGPCCPGGKALLSMGILDLSTFRPSGKLNAGSTAYPTTWSSIFHILFYLLVPIPAGLRRPAPLCGMGVTSFMDLTSKPTACKALMAVSRPGQVPLRKHLFPSSRKSVELSLQRSPMPIEQHKACLSLFLEEKPSRGPSKYGTVGISNSYDGIVKG